MAPSQSVSALQPHTEAARQADPLGLAAQSEGEAQPQVPLPRHAWPSGEAEQSESVEHCTHWPELLATWYVGHDEEAGELLEQPQPRREASTNESAMAFRMAEHRSSRRPRPESSRRPDRERAYPRSEAAPA